MASIPERGQALTPREAELFGVLTRECYSAKTAARRLGISHRTVEVHISNAIVKMGAQNMLHAALLWDREQRAAMVASLDCAHSCGVGHEVAQKLRRGPGQPTCDNCPDIPRVGRCKGGHCEAIDGVPGTPNEQQEQQ